MTYVMLRSVIASVPYCTVQIHVSVHIQLLKLVIMVHGHCQKMRFAHRRVLYFEFVFFFQNATIYVYISTQFHTVVCPRIFKSCATASGKTYLKNKSLVFTVTLHHSILSGNIQINLSKMLCLLYLIQTYVRFDLAKFHLRLLGRFFLIVQIFVSVQLISEVTEYLIATIVAIEKREYNH